MSEPHFSLAVDDLVPHRRAMSWLERVLEVDSERAVALATIAENHMFLREGRLDVWVGIEYMAQTVAAWAGHRAQREQRTVTLGFLVGTRRYDACRQFFRSGDSLRIEAACELMAGNGLGMFSCRILVDGELAASANLSVFEPPEGAHFLHNKGEASS
jgi:predicted hotdog family 3-hydroxylacyl-ACP dehydratase